MKTSKMPFKRTVKPVVNSGIACALLNKICPGWIPEHKFHPSRRWRFDFAHPDLKIGVEIDGAVWVRGRHTRGAGFLKDCEKINQAQLLGWRVFRYAPNQVAELINDIRAAVGGA